MAQKCTGHYVHYSIDLGLTVFIRVLGILVKIVEVYGVTKFQFQNMQKVKLNYCINFHNFGPKLTNWVFLESERTGGSEFSI